MFGIKKIGILFLLLFFTTAQANKEDAGSILGLIIGGVVGNQFGGGSGKIVATYVGAVGGSIFGASIGRDLDELDKRKISDSLEKYKTNHSNSWRNPDTKVHYTVTPVKTYYVEESRPCRNFTIDARIDGNYEKVKSTACRDKYGNWTMQWL